MLGNHLGLNTNTKSGHQKSGTSHCKEGAFHIFTLSSMEAHPHRTVQSEIASIATPI